MAKTTQNLVRQVLMNELGLTRDSVRDETKAIVHDVVLKTLDQGRLDRIIEAAVEKGMREHSWDKDVIKGLVKAALDRAIAKAIKKKIEDSLSLDIKIS